MTSLPTSAATSSVIENLFRTRVQNKTVGGALGAIILTTPLVAVIGHFIWINTALDNAICLVGLGIIVSIVGQFGDLMLSAIKRDLGLKDTAKLIPGHGGLLDRFD